MFDSEARKLAKALMRLQRGAYNSLLKRSAAEPDLKILRWRRLKSARLL